MIKEKEKIKNDPWEGEFQEFAKKSILIAGLLTEEEKDTNFYSKKKYAIQQWSKSAKDIFELEKDLKKQAEEEVEEINIKYALEEKGKILRREDGSYECSKEDELKRVREVRECIAKYQKSLSTKIVKFTPYRLLDEVTISKIDPFIREELTGVFI